MRAGLAGAAAIAAVLLAAPASAQSCAGGVCRVQLTPKQLLTAAERLVGARRFAEAAPLVAALAQAPGFSIQSRYLTGYIAAETGHPAEAAQAYRAILADDPKQTGVRLALGKLLLAMHKPASADRQFRIAEQDRDLPAPVLRTIRTARDTIRAERPWQLDASIGIAPDSNINNATAADSVTVMLGDTPIPLSLDGRARARSGLGETGQVSARVRLPAGPKLALLADLDATGTNYAGSAFDDYLVQIAGGVERKLSPVASVSAEAVGAQRWFGGKSASRQIGAKLGAQTQLDPRTSIGVQFDIRRTTALFDASYSGWQGGLYGTFERALSPGLVVSAGPFVRRDWLNQVAYSSIELGANAGLGGELAHGINFGVSAGLSRAMFDAPLLVFDADPRRDWRMTARATLGDRKLRLLGLSPQISWSVTRVEASIDFYRTSRSRFEFSLARYF